MLQLEYDILSFIPWLSVVLGYSIYSDINFKMVNLSVKHLKEKKKELDNCYQEMLEIVEDNLIIVPERFRRAWKSSKRFESGLLSYFVSQLQSDRIKTYIKAILHVLIELCENRNFLPHRIFEVVHHQNTLMPLQVVGDIICNLKDRRAMMKSALSMLKFFDYIEYWTKNNLHILSTERAHRLQSNLTEGRQRILDLIIRYRLYEYAMKQVSEDKDSKSFLNMLNSFLKSSYMKEMIEEFLSEKNVDFFALRRTLIYLLVIESGGMCTEYVSKISMSEFKSYFTVKDALVIRSSSNDLIVLNQMVKKLIFKYVQLRLDMVKHFNRDQEYLFMPNNMAKTDLVQEALSKLKQDMQKAGFQVKASICSTIIQRHFSTLRDQLLDHKQTTATLQEMIQLSYKMNEAMDTGAHEKNIFKRKIDLDDKPPKKRCMSKK